MDEIAYKNKEKEYFDEYEALCKRCGKCCGVDTDPCSNLAKDVSGKFYCKSYENRLGAQYTVSGRTFTCVNIRDVLSKSLPPYGCSYSNQG